MIKLEHTVLPSLEEMEFVIEGMRNPMNSWDKSDTCFGNVECYECTYHPVGIKCELTCYRQQHKIGPNDLSLMQKLSKAGTDHRKFMRMMPVCVRITAPLYWWKEFDTYKVGTVANSCSTMHKITEKEFAISDFSTDHLLPKSSRLMFDIVDELNHYRNLYLNYKDPEKKKEAWWQLIQLLPSSYNQTRNITLNYEVLANIYPSRCNHKLDEWHGFCDWIETLPYHELITC